MCPGRTTTHLATVVDSVTIAALADAVTHRGPARISRLPSDICGHPYGAGLDEAQTSWFLGVAARITGEGLKGLPGVRHEPPVRRWMIRGRAR